MEKAYMNLLSIYHLLIMSSIHGYFSYLNLSLS